VNVTVSSDNRKSVFGTDSHCVTWSVDGFGSGVVPAIW